jgi:hypothetical protein
MRTDNLRLILGLTAITLLTTPAYSAHHITDLKNEVSAVLSDELTNPGVP